MRSDLFAGTYARGPTATAVSGHAWLVAMLEAESALAQACAAEGLIVPEAAAAVARACATASDALAVDALAADAADHATAVIPLVKALRELVGPEHEAAVHLGATSQDIVDTAAMLIAKRALAAILEDADATVVAARELAIAHADTPFLARTLLQPALAIPFALEATTWADAVEEARQALVEALPQLLAVQMGGPVGARPAAIAHRVAELLELSAPARPWQTNRVRVARLAAALGVLAGALGKVARDVTLLAQGEVGEAREGGPEGRGGSSAMAHKRNPVSAVSVLACTRRVPGLVATILSVMDQEHQRGAGGWQAEWGTLSELLSLTGSAAAWSADLLGNLEVDADRMRANLLEQLGEDALIAPEGGER